MKIKIPPALTERDYRLYFCGQILSTIGTMMQMTSIGWQVKEMTNSAWMIGFVVALPMVIAGILSPALGIIADKFNRRNMLYVVQVVGILQASSLAYLTFTGKIKLWEILSLSIIWGLMNSVNGPLMHSFILSIMRNKNFKGSAGAMNGAMVNMAQFTGPAIAGLLIPAIGIGWNYVINAISFIPAIITLWLINYTYVTVPKGKVWPFLKAGFRSTFLEHPAMRNQILLVGLVGLFGFSCRTIMPQIASEMFHGKSSVFGWLTASVAVGSAIGSLIVARYEKGTAPYRKFVVGGTFFTGVSLLCFSFTRHLQFGIPFLALMGISFSIAFAMLRSTIQQEIPSGFEGRTMGVLFTLFFCGMGFGSMIAGRLGSSYSCATSIAVIGCSAIVAGLIMWKFVRAPILVKA